LSSCRDIHSLNREDAKAIRWGDLTEEEAIKFNTINPAKQLHIDKQIGSLEPGKDADLVIWSGHPLSVYNVAEQTWVDGVCPTLAPSSFFGTMAIV
jgi:imidazolonepropionase-like amidohydrolase